VKSCPELLGERFSYEYLHDKSSDSESSDSESSDSESSDYESSDDDSLFDHYCTTMNYIMRSRVDLDTLKELCLMQQENLIDVRASDESNMIHDVCRYGASDGVFEYLVQQYPAMCFEEKLRYNEGGEYETSDIPLRVLLQRLQYSKQATAITTNIWMMPGK
jgi:hypothetical protein